MVAFTSYEGVFLVASTLMVCSSVIVLFSKGVRQADVKPTEQSALSLADVLASLKSWELTAIYANSFSRMFTMIGLTGTVLPLYLNLQIRIPVELIGVMVSFRTVGTIAATAFSGYLSDRFGRKPMIVLGSLLESACFYAYTVTRLCETLLLIGLPEGLGRGMILTSMMVLLSEVVPSRLRGGVLGVYRTFMDVGGFTGPLFFIIVLEELGSNSTFLSAIIILVANIALIMTVRRENRTTQRQGRSSANHM